MDYSCKRIGVQYSSNAKTCRSSSGQSAREIHKATSVGNAKICAPSSAAVYRYFTVSFSTLIATVVPVIRKLLRICPINVLHASSDP
jgi:hypothetical protein